MIASILQSSPTFEAVNYNERKVAKGDATMLVIENFGYLEETKFTANDLRKYLIDYSKRNDRIQNPQFHVSFSCKGQEMTYQELENYARSWLAEMGYNDPKQPLLIYAHNDTENNHIHIITSRVNPEGKKINHNHERRRSKIYIDKTLGVDAKKDLLLSLEASFGYRYNSLGQWKAIMEATGYSVAEKDGMLKIVRNGVYQHTLITDEVLRRASKNKIEKKRLLQLKALLKKYRDLSTSKEELQEVMKKKFGIDIVYFGGADKPRGYFVVDHKNKQVCKGSEVLKLSELMMFESAEDKVKRVDAFLDTAFENNPQLTGIELHRLLKKYYAAGYKGGYILFKGKQALEIKPYMLEALRYNFKLQKIQQTFTYQSEEEKEVLCKLFKVDSKHLNDGIAGKGFNASLTEIRDIINELNNFQKIKQVLDENNIRLVKYNNKYFAISYSLRAKENYIYCLNDNGIDLQKKIGINQLALESITKNRESHVLPYHKREERGSLNINREYEVGGMYDDFDDERKLKR